MLGKEMGEGGAGGGGRGCPEEGELGNGSGEWVLQEDWG